jgi:hypothetical protein
MYFAMKRLLAILAASLLSCSAAEAQITNIVSANEVVRLHLTVLHVNSLCGFTGPLTPTSDLDPRYALTVRIDSTVPAITNLESGTAITFAVHSPALFLGGGAEKGKSYDISMPRKKAINLVPETRTAPPDKHPQATPR